MLLEDKYPPEQKEGQDIQKRLVQESSAIGDYEDSMDKPGSSFLWVGEDHHINREQVGQLVMYMKHWLEHGRLPVTSMQELSEMSDKEILAEMGWTVECQSPYEIRHEDGSFATGHAAHLVTELSVKEFMEDK